MGSINRLGVLASQCAGVAAHCAEGRGTTVDEAIAEIHELLAQAKIRPGSEAAVRVLDQAVAVYRSAPDPFDSWWWAEAAIEVLIRAGAQA